MSPEFVLGPALTEAVLVLVRRVLDSTQAKNEPEQPASKWMTPPQAWKISRVPVKAIRELVRAGEITARLRNRGDSPKQPKYLVNVDEVILAVEKRARETVLGKPMLIRSNDIKDRATRLRAKSGGR